MLIDSDWTQMVDAPITDKNKQEWAVYRQQLRDITSARTPEHVVYPIRPEYKKKEITNNPVIDIKPPQDDNHYYHEGIAPDFHYEYSSSGSGDWFNYFTWKQVDKWDSAVPNLILKIYDPETKELLVTERYSDPRTAEWLYSLDNENWIPFDGAKNEVGLYLMIRSFAFDFEQNYILILSTEITNE